LLAVPQPCTSAQSLPSCTSWLCCNTTNY